MLAYGLLIEYECCTGGYSHEYEYTHEYTQGHRATSTKPRLALKPSSHRLLGSFSAFAAEFGIVALLDRLDGRLEL